MINDKYSKIREFIAKTGDIKKKIRIFKKLWKYTKIYDRM